MYATIYCVTLLNSTQILNHGTQIHAQSVDTSWTCLALGTLQYASNSGLPCMQYTPWGGQATRYTPFLRYPLMENPLLAGRDMEIGGTWHNGREKVWQKDGEEDSKYNVSIMRIDSLGLRFRLHSPTYSVPTTFIFTPYAWTVPNFSIDTRLRSGGGTSLPAPYLVDHQGLPAEVVYPFRLSCPDHMRNMLINGKCGTLPRHFFSLVDKLGSKGLDMAN